MQIGFPELENNLSRTTPNILHPLYISISNHFDRAKGHVSITKSTVLPQIQNK